MYHELSRTLPQDLMSMRGSKKRKKARSIIIKILRTEFISITVLINSKKLVPHQITNILFFFFEKKSATRFSETLSAKMVHCRNCTSTQTARRSRLSTRAVFVGKTQGRTRSLTAKQTATKPPIAMVVHQSQHIPHLSQNLMWQTQTNSKRALVATRPEPEVPPN